MRYTVVRVNPETLQSVALLEGEPVPDWAKDLVQADDLVDGDDGSDDKGPDYSSMKPEELQAEVDSRNDDREDDELIEVTGTGANGNVKKSDLIAALEADDAAQSA